MKLAACLIASSIPILGGCAGAPSTQSPITLGSASQCKNQLATFGIAGATGTVSDPGVPLILLSTIATLGGNVVGYDLCKDMTTLTLAPTTTVRDGVYTPADSEFSVRLPAQLATDAQPGIRIWQRTKGWWENAFFVPTQTEAVVYGVSLNRKLTPDEAKMSDEQYADSLMGSTERLEFDISGAVSVTRLYREDVWIGKGLPGVMEIFKTDYKNSGDQPVDPQSGQSKPAYLIYYISKTKRTAAILSILWRDACPSCAAGPNLAIRSMAPGIATFVDSFRFNETRSQ